MTNTDFKVTSASEIAAQLFLVLPYSVTEHYSKQKDLSTLDFLEDFVSKNQKWSDAFMTKSYSQNDVVHDFIGIVSEEEFFVPRLSK